MKNLPEMETLTAAQRYWQNDGSRTRRKCNINYLSVDEKQSLDQTAVHQEPEVFSFSLLDMWTTLDPGLLLHPLGWKDDVILSTSVYSMDTTNYKWARDEINRSTISCDSKLSPNTLRGPQTLAPKKLLSRHILPPVPPGLFEQQKWGRAALRAAGDARLSCWDGSRHLR